MIADFLSQFKEIHTVFNLFNYITFRCALAFVFSFSLTFLLLKVFIRRAKGRFYERISEDVPKRHRIKEGTPSSGGLVFVPASIISTVLWARPVMEIVLAVVATVVMGTMGFIDDVSKLKRKDKKGGLRKTYKIIFQLVLGVIFAIGATYIFGDKAFMTQVLFIKNYFINLGIFYFVFVSFVIAGTSNAVNLTDGLDGLAAGVVLFPMAVLGIVAYFEGNFKFANYLNILYIKNAGQLSIFASAFFGSLVAFLWYNSYPAEIFMGDTGSQALGGALASLAVLTKQEVLLAVAGGVLVMETLSVALQIGYFKLTGGKRIFRRAPIHHHFEEMGWGETKVVVRFWIASLLFSLVAVATLKIR